MGRGERGHRPWLWVAAAVPSLLVGLAMTLSSVSVWGERDDYRAARVCEDGPADGCVVDTTAVVERTRVYRRKADSYDVWLRLDRPELAPGTAGRAVELPDPDLVFDSLTEGRAVGVRIWDGRVARIDVPGVGSAETQHSPLTKSLEQTLVGVAFLAAGSWGLWGGVAMAREHGWRRTPVAPLKGRLGRGLGRVSLGMLSGVAAAYVLVVTLDVYHPAALLAVPATAVVVWWALGRR